MLRSDRRILTTHTGSLPRPARLTELYARRSRGEPVDPAELRREGLAALRAGHRPAGGQRASTSATTASSSARRFFLYVQRRMSGFGAGWTRRPFADMTRYPGFAAWKAAHDAVGTSISNIAGVPEAVGEVRYLDPAAIEQDCTDFAAALAEEGRPFAEAFLTAPSPGIVALAMRNRFYPDDAAYLEALGAALRVEYQAIVKAGFVLQIDAPDLAMERHLTFQDRPVADFVAFVRRVVAVINRALEGIPPDRVRLHACWGNYEGPHDSDVALLDILPAILEARVGGFVLALRQSPPRA